MAGSSESTSVPRSATRTSPSLAVDAAPACATAARAPTQSIKANHPVTFIGGPYDVRANGESGPAWRPESCGASGAAALGRLEEVAADVGRQDARHALALEDIAPVQGRAARAAEDGQAV